MITETVYRKQGRSGSYDRGFKFTTTEYRMLEKGTGWNKEYSLDGGKTWASSEYLAWKDSDRKDRVKLNSTRRGELAFDAIQKINREFDSDYQWRA